MTRHPWRAAVAAIGLLVPPTIAVSAQQAGADASPERTLGAWTAPFEEQGGTCITDADGRQLCKPAGASVVDLANGQVLYWDALEGTENVNLSVVAEFGQQARNDRTRLIDLSGAVPSFSVPAPQDAGANPGGYQPDPLPAVPTRDPVVNDGDLFCSDPVQLADGRIMAVGGTDYYAEPYVASYNGHDYGVVELEGIKNARIFDPASNTWTQSGSMSFGRWYPSLVTLPNGNVFVASGVTKLLKPLYADRPMDSGTNVKQTETYDPTTGQWTLDPDTANKSLPLFPRLHLLPDGHVYYDAAGQVFNPFGQSYDEALWNIASSYDPATQRWTDLGVPGLGVGAPLPSVPGVPLAGGDITTLPGFRGSTFSIMLPLTPDAEGRYGSASFLSAGGILGVTPGTYVASTSSQINTVTTDATTHAESLSSVRTGDLNQPRWYGTGVLLPNGQVITFSGANRDEVVLPGTGTPVTTPELFDPATNTWTELASQSHGRTYHNTAMLLADGRVLVGGHAPISTVYGFDVTVPGMSQNEGRDPSFEIYSPPYLFRGDRPVITAAPGSIATGSTFTIATPDADAIAAGGTVVLVRNTAITHLIDGDQRTVELRIVGHDANTLTLAAPPDDNVTPPGPYMLFVDKPTSDGLTPSVSKQVFVDAPVPAIVAAPGATPAQPSPPVSATPPVEVIQRNLDRAVGPLPTVPGAPTPAANTNLDATPASDRLSAPSTPVLVLIGALPFAVLLLLGGLGPRRRTRRRASG